MKLVLHLFTIYQKFTYGKVTDSIISEIFEDLPNIDDPDIRDTINVDSSNEDLEAELSESNEDSDNNEEITTQQDQQIGDLTLYNEEHDDEQVRTDSL